MKRTLTGEQFRYLWREAGGDVVKRPLQVSGAARTRSESAARAAELAAWWRFRPDPALLSAVRTLRRPELWLEATAVDARGRPLRGLVGVGAACSTLVLQDPVQEPSGTAAERSPRGAGPTWSLARGGDCHVESGRTELLVARLCAGLPRYPAGGGTVLSAALAAVAPVPTGRGAREPLSVRATRSDAEQIRALGERPRRCEAYFQVTTPAGVAGEAVRAGLAWLVGDDGGHLLDGDGIGPVEGPAVVGTPDRNVRARPCGTAAVEAAVRALLARAQEHPRV
ncbi:ESX secretion-associated protein EspG [Tomitella cavernea]|uniref:ESX secretion-associated protein EspG n=1 Tax=Tomitella cavernea TaxID=1387982 RepID=A0ABP9CC30_9ACTN|nr:ESX secretion-associated protein EspG [Tomitella cavernea]